MSVTERSLPVFDVERVRADFPILGTSVRGKPLVYLDSAATSQKPQVVIDTIGDYYRQTNANVHRGVYQLSAEATRLYEDARNHVARLVGAEGVKEIVFVRGTTEAINLVAQSFVRPRLSAGDEIVVSNMEHHSNIVPWQLLAEATGARVRVIPMNERGELELDAYRSLLSDRTKVVAVGHVSNALGTVNPIKEMIGLAHEKGVPVVVDGAQAVAHLDVDVVDLDVDFYAFSAHKAYGPTGVGALYAKSDHLAVMSPYQGGGDMIRSVSFDGSTFAEPPHRFEAGTPNIAGAIGWAAAIDYVDSIGMSSIHAYNDELLRYATERLSAIDGLRLIGTADEKVSVLSFVLDGVHPHDIGTVLDAEGIAVRTGHHCAQPVMEFFGVPATTRASLTFYNTKAEIDTLVRGLERVKEMFGA